MRTAQYNINAQAWVWKLEGLKDIALCRVATVKVIIVLRHCSTLCFQLRL